MLINRILKIIRPIAMNYCGILMSGYRRHFKTLISMGARHHFVILSHTKVTTVFETEITNNYVWQATEESHL